MEKIDFVIPWVDGSDPEWIQKRNRYLESGGKKDFLSSDYRDIRYREWGTLRFWFRAVDKYAPWVNTVHFVTDHQVPKWLNTNCDKLKIVYHEDFIPKEYLPTFSSHAIEIFFHKIPGLSDNFVYFNDDTYLTDYVKPTDFFLNGKPKALGILNIKTFNIDDTMGFSQLVDAAVINKYFVKNDVIKSNFFKWFNYKYGFNFLRTVLLMPWKDIPDLYLNHLPTNMNKETYNIVWNKEHDILEKAALHKFRNYTDVNQWLFSFWQICSGQFEPQEFNIGKAFCIGDDLLTTNYVCNVIKKRKYKMICIGEGNDITGVEKAYIQILETLKKTFPERSMFEL